MMFGANFWGANFWGRSYWGGTGQLIDAEQEAEDAMHWNSRKERWRQRQAARVEPPPRAPAPPAPLPPQAAVAALVEQLTDVRAPAPRREGYGGGVTLPFQPRRLHHE